MKITFIIVDNWSSILSQGMEPVHKRSVTLELTEEQVKKIGIKSIGKIDRNTKHEREVFETVQECFVESEGVES